MERQNPIHTVQAKDITYFPVDQAPDQKPIGGPCYWNPGASGDTLPGTVESGALSQSLGLSTRIP